MSETIHFDTHRFVKRMTKSGMTEEMAEALADEQIRLIQGELATKQDMEALRLATKQDIEALRLATKQDLDLVHRDIEQLRKDTTQSIEALRQETKQNIEELRLSTKTDMAELKSELIKWMAGILIAQGGVIVALLRLIPA